MRFAVVSMVTGAGILTAVAVWLVSKGHVTPQGTAVGALGTVAFGLLVGAKVALLPPKKKD